MSVETNSQLLDRAAEMIEFWTGTALSKVLQADIERNDLDALRGHVNQAEAQASRVEAADVH